MLPRHAGQERRRGVTTRVQRWQVVAAVFLDVMTVAETFFRAGTFACRSFRSSRTRRRHCAARRYPCGTRPPRLGFLPRDPSVSSRAPRRRVPPLTASPSRARSRPETKNRRRRGDGDGDGCGRTRRREGERGSRREPRRDLAGNGRARREGAPRDRRADGAAPGGRGARRRMPRVRQRARHRAVRLARLGAQVHVRPRVPRVGGFREGAVRAVRRAPGQGAPRRLQRHGARVRSDGFGQDLHDGHGARRVARFRVGNRARTSGRDSPRHAHAVRARRGASR